MNIFKLEFRKKFKPMLIWIAAILAWAMIVIAFIPTLVEEGHTFADLIERMGAFADVMNINTDTFSTVLGIIGMYFGMLLIVFGIQSANYGFGLVTIEESELTADFLITKPVKRSKILTYKILASITIMFITCTVYTVVSYFTILGVSGDNEVNRKALLLVLCSSFFVQLFFFAVGLLISLFLKKVKSTTPFSMGLAFGMFILDAFSRNFEIDIIRYVNPLSFFSTATIAKDAAYNTKFFIINLIIVAISIALSYILYQKRDIKSV